MKLIKKSIIFTFIFVMTFSSCVFATSLDATQPTNSLSSTQQIVWLPTKGGTKYHSSPTCSNMKSPVAATLDVAISTGYKACSKCCSGVVSATPALATSAVPAGNAVAATAVPVATVPSSANLVWVPTKGGKKYHSSASCSNMKSPKQVTVDQAVSAGFTQCSKCY